MRVFVLYVFGRKGEGGSSECVRVRVCERERERGRETERERERERERVLLLSMIVQLYGEWDRGKGVRLVFIHFLVDFYFV